MQNVVRQRRWLYSLIIGVFLLASSGCSLPNVTQWFESPVQVAEVPETPPAVSTTDVSSTGAIVATPESPTSTRPRQVAATRKPAATKSPQATATSEPSETPALTATPLPSATLEPSPTVTPEPAPTQVTLEPFDPALAATLQSILDQTVADGYIPGAVLSVSVPGVEAWSGASGVLNRQQGQPMTPDTRVRVASISKMFTAVVVLQLAEEGQLDLAAPVSAFFPDLLPNGEATTVRNLLNHTSGLYDYLEDRNFGQLPYVSPERVFEPWEMVNYATQFPPAFSPGAPGYWDYSSTNYVILGMIIEQVTGHTLAEEMRQRIFTPLGLQATFCSPADVSDGVMASGYSNQADLTNTSMSFAFATANIVATVDDIRRFAVALFGGELLEPETRALMQTFENGHGSYSMPELEYGLGFMRNRLPVGPGPDGQLRPSEVSRVLGHIGGFGGFRSAVWYAPENGITVSLAVNQFATDPNTLATRAFDAILTHQGR